MSRFRIRLELGKFAAYVIIPVSLAVIVASPSVRTELVSRLGAPYPKPEERNVEELRKLKSFQEQKPASRVRHD